MFGLTGIGEALLTRDSWDHRVLIVVILLPCDQVILVQLFLDIGHVSVGTQRLLSLDLLVKLVLVQLHRNALLLSALLLELAIEDAVLLRLVGIVLTHGPLLTQFAVLIHVHLIEQLLLVLIPDPLMVLLGHLGSLILQRSPVLHLRLRRKLRL